MTETSLHTLVCSAAQEGGNVGLGVVMFVGRRILSVILSGIPDAW